MMTENCPLLWATIELETRDQYGRLTESRVFPAESYVIGMLDTFYSGAAKNVTDTGGTSRSLPVTPSIDGTGPLATATRGIVVGTGTTAVTVGDTKLQTQVLEGAAANLIHHILEEFTTPATSGSTRSFKATRLFLNDSGSDIVINEVGYYMLTSGWNFCLARDIVSPGITVVNLGSLTVRYTIGVTV